MRVPASLSTVSPAPVSAPRLPFVAMAQKVPPPKKATPKVPARKPALNSRQAASRRPSVWGRTEEPVIRWWNDSMQSNLEKDGPMRWVGRAQWAGSPLAMLVLGPLEALLVTLRQHGPHRR